MSETKNADKLRTYLRSAKDELNSAATVHCVVGNEAADLDSMASAVLYAYYRNETRRSENELYVPVISIPREDFKLRTEAVYLFTEAGLGQELLIFAEDIDLKALYTTGRLALTLVDHNKPTGAYTEYQDAVRGVLDHHADEKMFTDAGVRVIEPVGSAATLVAEQILAEKPELLEDGAITLLLGTVLLDTVNLDPGAERVTPKDEEVAKKLLERSNLKQQELFDAVQREKFNVSALSSADLLRKDYKEWKLGGYQVGISSVLLSISDWLAKDAALSQSLARYAESHKLDLLLAMNAYTAPEFTRELVVYCPDEALRKQVLEFLKESNLGLSSIESNQVDDATALFAQGNLGMSRKKLQPVLAEFFEKLS